MTAGRQPVSNTKHWCTPPSIVDSVRKCFGGSIALDPCSNEHSMVGAQTEYRLPDRDGLAESWDFPSIYVNPPYGSDPSRGTRILHWFSRISDAADSGSEVIGLVPVATNTAHWKRHVYIDGVEDPKGAPMSCAVIYWGQNPDTFAESFQEHGAVVSLVGTRLPEAELSLFA